MFAIAVCGHSDNYRFNLIKRGALDRNCTAEVLSDTDNEVLFIDYTTLGDVLIFPQPLSTGSVDLNGHPSRRRVVLDAAACSREPRTSLHLSTVYG